MLTQEYLRSILDYDPETGLFAWKYNDSKPKWWNTRFATKVAGTVSKSTGYVQIYIDGKPFRGHRLAFLWMTGGIPKTIDHIDRIKSNNIWSNLRNATDSQNMANKALLNSNTSGYKNVYWRKDRQKWHVQIQKESKNVHGGYFTELKEAVEKANALRYELFGEFAVQEIFKE